ncbi:MAG: Quino(hemo)protein alcohol dehydrogenase, PQQ-dependent [Nitrospira sp.]|jgi:alcohol dehydrogenase (cytochrome c)|nr:MAG: Quino(hemo)protein alcohol dehydrogenase, PQQ-dependent [Nitrospira sp.]
MTSRDIDCMTTFVIAATCLFLTVSCGASRQDYPMADGSRPLGSLSNAKGSAPPVAHDVTSARIAGARSEPHNWLTYYGAYDGWRYSPLNQITRENVTGLRPAWVFQSGQIGLTANPATYAFESSPLVVDGVMFLSGWDGYVWALDAETGQELWRYKHEIPLDTPLCCGNVNRGVAVARGKVFFASQNGYLVALDATSGKSLWSRPFVDIRAGESATMAPLIVKNLVIVGNSGAEFGVRGHIDAFDLHSGRRIWRRYNVPKPGEPGSHTWPKESQAWERGGGTAWVTGTYDPEADILYWGTSNPGPDFDGSVRPGDNWYTDSVLALNPDDGSLKWHYQWTPHDVWDYSGVNENILVDEGGKKLLAHFDRNGHLFILDRTTGALMSATPFVAVTWGRIDEKGRVTVRKTPTPEGTVICPGPAGGKEWVHAAYSPRTKLLYTPVIDACATFTLKPAEFREGLPYWGGEASVMGQAQAGHVKAYDLTGKEVWTWNYHKPMVSSLLVTAGDVLFAGQPTGEFNGFDAGTGKLLWQFQTGSGIHSSPMTYSVKGKQYVAVPAGWGGWMKGFSPDLIGSPRGDALFVFALP